MTGAPLLLIHGFMGGSAQWETVGAALGDRIDILAIDHPGYGAAAGRTAPGRIEDFAANALDWATSQGADRFHLLGHSMGGMIAQEMIAMAPERVEKLVLYGTGATGVLPGRFETIAESKRRVEADGPVATARRISATWFLNGADSPAYEDCAAIAELTSVQAMHAGLDAMEAWRAVDKLPAIRSETQIIWGDGDRSYAWAQIEQLWTTIPNARLAVIPGCSHAAHLEKPGIFNLILEDFLGL